MDSYEGVAVTIRERFDSPPLEGWLYRESALGFLLAQDEEGQHIRWIPRNTYVAYHVDRPRAKFASTHPPLGSVIDDDLLRDLIGELDANLIVQIGHAPSEPLDRRLKRCEGFLRAISASRLGRVLIENERELNVRASIELIPIACLDSAQFFAWLGGDPGAVSDRAFGLPEIVRLRPNGHPEMFEETERLARALQLVAQAVIAGSLVGRSRTITTVDLQTLPIGLSIPIACYLGLHTAVTSISRMTDFSAHATAVTSEIRREQAHHPATPWQRLSDLIQAHGRELLSMSGAGLRGLAIGRRDGQPLCQQDSVGDLVLAAFVDKKLSRQEMEAERIVHAEEAFRTIVGQSTDDAGLSMDVVECGGAFRPLSQIVANPRKAAQSGAPPILNAQKYFHTLRSGIGITNPHCEYPSQNSVGTLGFFVTDQEGGIHLVSNNHVIGRTNAASRGEAVVQPGTLDLTADERNRWPLLADIVGALKVAEISAVVPLEFANPPVPRMNNVDVTMARLINSRPETDTARLTFAGNIRGVASPYYFDSMNSLVGNIHVYKVGRTTGFTEGEATYVGGLLMMPYGRQYAYFTEQILVTPTQDNVGLFCDDGDSGSGVLNTSHELVGMLVGSSVNQAVVSPIALILDALGREFAAPLRVVTG